jgi:pyruvate,water dikinase
VSAATSERILWFADIGRDDVDRTGGKGASLGELLRAGIRVPPGCVVSTLGFETFMTTVDPDGSLRAGIGALESEDLDRIRQLSSELRQQIARTPLDAQLEAEFAAMCEQLFEHADGVAVRSSATCEDSENASFAGLQDTYLWVSAKNVSRRIRDCWASLYNFESVSYRRRLEMLEDQISMAVVVQAMVKAHCAGVMFSRSPTTGDKSVVIIEGSWGLGSSVVSGEVTPDKFIVNKVTGKVIDRVIANKPIRHVRDAEGLDFRVEDVPEAMREQPCVEDSQISELVRIARQCEAHYGRPQDMEWAIDSSDAGEGDIYLLQSRPETVWSQRKPELVSKPKEKAFEHVFSVLGNMRSK